MSASRPFQGDTGEGVISRRSGPAVAAAGRKSALRGAHPVCRGKVTKSSAIPPPPARFFLHRAAVVRRAPRPLFPPRLRRSKSCAFFVSAPLFFRRSPTLFSFGGRVALLRGVKCAVLRARVSRTRQPLLFFCLHRFTHPAQRTDYLHIASEGFAFSSSPRSTLPHGGRRCERQAQRARREIGQFLLMRR